MKHIKYKDIREWDGVNVRLVICPDCNEWELWSIEEMQNHGICKHKFMINAKCPLCKDPLVESDYEGPRTIITMY